MTLFNKNETSITSEPVADIMALDCNDQRSPWSDY